MATTTTALRRQIGSASDLKSVVRTMKALPASAIGQYERSVAAIADYARTVEIGLGLCLRSADPNGSYVHTGPTPPEDAAVHAVVFGSDQELVGRFNEVVVERAIQHLGALPARAQVWAVGQRVQARLLDAGTPPVGSCQVPGSVEQITRLVGQILLKVQVPDSESVGETPGATLMLFYNRPTGSGYEPVSQRLLPLDDHWQRELARQPWPTTSLPEVLGAGRQALRAFVREHLFVSLFRASAESLASENASRLAAMQRADRNIGELLVDLGAKFRRTRQSGIDEELFDVIAGFDALDPTRPCSADPRPDGTACHACKQTRRNRANTMAHPGVVDVGERGRYRLRSPAVAHAGPAGIGISAAADRCRTGATSDPGDRFGESGIALLAEAPEWQLERVRVMATHISPRPGFTPHPMTIAAATEMLSLVARSGPFRSIPPRDL